MRNLAQAVCVALLAAVASCQSQAPKYPSPEQMAQSARQATVGIAALCKEGIQFGSGTITRLHTVITAAHVVMCEEGPAKEALVEYRDASGGLHRTAVQLAVQLKRDGHAIDAAVLTTEDALVGPVVETNYAPGIGATVCLSAYMPNTLWACTAIAETENKEAQVAQAVYPGNSGGGAFDEAGQLIGVIVRSTPCYNQKGVMEICGGVILLLAGSSE